MMMAPVCPTEMIASIFETILSSLISLLPLILETIILYLISTPLYGLRFVPLYGTYYFYQSIVPKRQVLIISHVVLQVFEVISAVALYFLFFVWIFGGDISKYIYYAIPFFVISIADLVIRIIINMDVAEAFEYNKYLGVLFVFIPLIGDICMLINAKKFNYVPIDHDEV